MEKKGELKMLAEEFNLAGIPVLLDEPLSAHCTWKIGGPADLFFSSGSAEEIQRIVKRLNHTEIPWIVIGDGSNLLFADEGVRGAVIKIGSALSRIDISGSTVLVEAGVWVPELALKTARAGLIGLEHTIGIPGRLGGLVSMNGGSQRQSIGSVIRRVTCIEPDGELRDYDRENCDFSYRHSRFLEGHSIIVGVEMELQHGRWPEMRREMRGILKSRRQKFPRKLPNCGSVFKSDPAMYEMAGPPGKIIEECGFKGRRRGGAQVSPLHANFIVNTGGATAKDVRELILEIRDMAQTKYGIRMETEARFVSPNGDIAAL